MLKQILILLALSAGTSAFAQKPEIKLSEVERIEKTLAADDMRGRRAGTPDIDRAAAFIAAEFKKAGLQPGKGNSYLQEFSMVRPRLKSVKAEMDGVEIPARNVLVNATETDLKVNEKSGYQVRYIRKGDTLRNRIREFMAEKKNAVVFVDTSFARFFPRMGSMGGSTFKGEEKQPLPVIIYVLGDYQPKEFTIKAEQTMDETKYANVVGLLPGKSKKDEYVIFSGHYDHLGVAREPQQGDSIYNGANDDAAGTTAVMVLADYFRKLNNNERTLVFVAFTAEEAGGFGSQYFSRQYDPQKVVAMFNIEMIGTESKWGRGSAYITGFEKTDMGTILQKNLNGTSFTFYPDPYPGQNLFLRSDNATLARLGVPAHTISTAKMDMEPNYHKLTDEVSSLDLENMKEIIRAIAVSAGSIISGKDTPARIKN